MTAMALLTIKMKITLPFLMLCIPQVKYAVLPAKPILITALYSRASHR
ncbi:hypothetical protein C942_01572 [Photobacterium marinum]|uniref:Uncharacterized protein n=1 Tax=Photobacterium marinum TaxID=1056511 RepID=L8JJN7_9GAMM|nr:hypothetical protein C942_01572 [Photobacterium marinum]